MEKAINYFCHEHPLFLNNQYDGEALDCDVCGKVVTNLEPVYACEQSLCNSSRRSSVRVILHKRCGELPRRLLSDPSHPKHPLHLFDYRHLPTIHDCDICGVEIGFKLGYRCPSCDFDIHIECGNSWLLKERVELQHPSHIHPLTLMRSQELPFMCDGCGTKDVDMAYICNTCEYWVHAACASLPIILSQERHQHHHPLSLAFCFPMKHRRYQYKCVVCDKDFDTKCWLYFCGDCRYFVHLKCVGTTTKQDVLSIDDDQSDVIQFPLGDISKMLITPFVMRERGISVLNVNEMPATIKMPQTTSSYSYLFNYHRHPLTFVSQDNDEGNCKSSEDDNEDEDKELKICDVCVTHISSPSYQCSDCHYFIHLICYLLPKTLSVSSSSTSQYGECSDSDDTNHTFALYVSSKESDEDPELPWCDLCGNPTNGMMYRCEECEMIIDVKCASLPTTIKHASHSHSHSHPNLIMSTLPEYEKCYCCENPVGRTLGYICSKDDCKFVLDLKCAQLQPIVRKQEWDHHPLLFTSDASADHPSDFYCEFCEKDMHPKRPMYHCRQCDQSYHFRCLKAESGFHRNVKFGRRFELDSVHPHPLTHNYITLKKRCDICRKIVYTHRGFECVSCYFVVCVTCGDKALANKM